MERITSFSLLSINDLPNVLIAQDVGCCSSLLQGHIADLSSTSCPPVCPGVFLLNCFPASLPPVVLVLWGYFSQGSEVCTSLYWTSQDSSQSVGMSLHGSRISWCIICKVSEGTFCPTIQIINEDVKQYEALALICMTTLQKRLVWKGLQWVTTICRCTWWKTWFYNYFRKKMRWYHVFTPPLPPFSPFPSS